MKNRPYPVALLLLAFLAIAVLARATSTPINVDQKVCTGTAAASAGTMTCDYATTTDRATRLVANVGMSALATGHLTATSFITCEYVVENKNGTVSAPTAITSSNNPSNNTTSTFVAAHAQASDSAFASTGPSTCVWSISGTNARVTVTNQGATAADVTVWVQAFSFGSQ
ncbi:MAG TPA: hypothetical protein VGH28_10605 [Polyangiaceae bacterium]|jgi:hypothetical protein